MADSSSRSIQRQPTKFSPEDLDKFGPFVALIGELLGRSILWWKLRNLRKRERERAPAREKLIATIREQRKKASEQGMQHYERIYNVSLYVMILDYDLAVISSYYASAYRTWERRFAARQLAVILYEASEDLPQLLGGDFRNTLNRLPLWDGAVEDLNVIGKRLSTFKRSNEEILWQLRIFVGAHRDRDAGKQLEVIDSIEPLAIYKLAADLYESIHPITEILIKVTTILGRPEVIRSHLLKMPEFTNPPQGL